MSERIVSTLSLCSDKFKKFRSDQVQFSQDYVGLPAAERNLLGGRMAERQSSTSRRSAPETSLTWGFIHSLCSPHKTQEVKAEYWAGRLSPPQIRNSDQILDFQLETAMPSSKKPSMTINSIIAVIDMGKTIYFSLISQNRVTYCSWSSQQKAFFFFKLESPFPNC